MTQKVLSGTPLILPQLEQAISALPSSGKLITTAEKYTYLKVDNIYFQAVLPLFNNPKITIQDHGEVGAHISVIYPEEAMAHKINLQELHLAHEFKITGAFCQEFNQKLYYALKINSPSLIAIRQKYGLGDLLNYQGYWVNMHMTIGVKQRLRS